MFILIPVPRIRARPRQAPPAPPPAHFALQPTTQDGETALFQDARIGFSHALPGWPQATAVTSGPGEPPADALIQFWDFPMWLRYRVETMTGPAPSAMHVAVDWATRYARNRTRAQLTAAPVRADRIAAWQVDAAAVASYSLVQPDAFGATDEDLAVLVRHGTILTVTRRHAGSTQDWVRHAAFRAAVDATMLWDPQRFRYDARIWPPSSFLEPMLPQVLVAGRLQALPGLASAMRLPEAEGEGLGEVLKRMIESDTPPWQAVSPEDRERWRQAFFGAVATRSVLDLLQRGLAEVQTAHDLRGFAVMTGMAMSQATG
jgi:hypothetical protein